MPQPKIPEKDLIEALNLIEQYGSSHKAFIAGASPVPESTLRRRAQVAKLDGLRPTITRDAPRIHSTKRLGKMHLIIPDVQSKPGVRLDHLTWIGNYITEKQPDNIICIGDFFDFPSLSSFDKGKLAFEGRRYVEDIKAGRRAMQNLMDPLEAYNRTAKVKYQPQMDFTLGNHEQRIIRIVDSNPEFFGKFSYDDMAIGDYGWKVHDFLKPVTIDGVTYCHYFTSGVMGRPVSSAAALLRERQSSCVMGHVQKTDIAIHPKTGNTALFCGICYLHDEDYLGYQGQGPNNRRQIVVLHEVDDGQFDMMFVSLKFLEKGYS
jgi:hypothetical protein